MEKKQHIRIQTTIEYHKIVKYKINIFLVWNDIL